MGERERGFKELAHVIWRLVRSQDRPREVLTSQLESKGLLRTEFPLPLKTSGLLFFFLLKASTDWMRPTHTAEGHLLSSKSTDLNVNLI